jgi:gamma-glutamylputrescine oxidase
VSRQSGGRPEVGFESSWYHATRNDQADRATLTEDLDCDVCVIGGGYTGLSAALTLSEAGFKVVLLEQYRIGSGASGRNGGVLGIGQRKDQEDLERMVDPAWARQLWQMALDANALVRARIHQYSIPCHLSDGELTLAHRARYQQDLWDHTAHLKARYGYEDCHPLNRREVSDRLGSQAYFGGYLDTRAGHLHPLNLAQGLAKAAESQGAQLFELSAVTGFEAVSADRMDVRTTTRRVRAQKVVLACNGYLNGLAPEPDGYQMPINNFMVATEPLGDALASEIIRDNQAVVDTRFVVNYFHLSDDQRLIFGGGENYTRFFPKDIRAVVRKRLLAIYPQLADVDLPYAWGGTLSVTMNRMPKFGRLGQNLYYGQGYSGHGVAMANMGGHLIAEAIKGQAEGFDCLANLKHRKFPGGRWLRWPGLVAGMLFYAALDRV